MDYLLHMPIYLSNLSLNYLLNVDSLVTYTDTNEQTHIAILDTYGG